MTIGDSVTNIAEGAFSYCASLASITIPESINIMEDYAFWNCSSLTGIYFEGYAPYLDGRPLAMSP